jgi:hypothetical protein
MSIVRDIADNDPHITHEVVCLSCLFRWIAVHPLATLLRDLECPGCEKQGHAICTGQHLDA